MSEKLITLPIPDELYERMQEAAAASERSLEDVLLETLGVAFQTDVDFPSLEALGKYTNEQLWAVVQRRVAWGQSLRLRELSAKNKLQKLTQDEEIELDHLLDLNDSYILLRSQALLLLKERGQNISSHLSIGA